MKVLALILFIALAAAQNVQIRIAHTSQNAGKLDVHFLEGNETKATISNVVFGQTTVYSELAIGNYTVKITKAGQEAPEFESAFEPHESNQVYSLVIVGLIGNETATPLALLTISDDNSAPATSLTSRIRFINAVAGETLKVDVYFNDQGPIFQGVDYKGITAYNSVGVDSYRIDIFEAGSTTNHLLAVNYQVVGGQVVTLIVDGIQNQTSVQVSTDKSYTYFQLRAAHTSPDAGSVDILVDDQKNLGAWFQHSHLLSRIHK